MRLFDIYLLNSVYAVASVVIMCIYLWYLLITACISMYIYAGAAVPRVVEALFQALMSEPFDRAYAALLQVRVNVYCYYMCI